MRFFITLSYDGTRYHGWQVQPNGPSVQEKLQWALSTILRQDILVTGAGRTDAGVHARMMVAHFDVESLPMDAADLAYKLNRLLPQDIAIQDNHMWGASYSLRLGTLAQRTWRKDETQTYAFTVSADEPLVAKSMMPTVIARGADWIPLKYRKEI